MIKILFIIGTLDVGGTERQLVELVTRLNRRRFRPVVCCLSSAGPLAETLTAAGVPVHVVGFRGFMKFRGLSFIRNTPKVLFELFRLVRLVRAEAPDIVHGLLFWAYVLGTFAARLARVPVVVTSRRGLGHFKASKLHYLLIERVANLMTDVVVANSQAVRQDALQQEHLPADKVLVIHNGLDPGPHGRRRDPRLRASFGLPEGAPVVAVVANFIHYKGHRFFLDAWGRVVGRFPSAAALLIGDGPLRVELEQQARGLAVPSSVLFVGTRHDVAGLLAESDLLVHPSLEEGFSNAILEAMASGKPVVATNVGGNPEAVIDGETGLLVPPGDPEALAAAMIRLLSNSGDAARLGAAGRRRVVELFAMPRMIQQYEALYERLVAPPAAGIGPFAAGR